MNVVFAIGCKRYRDPDVAQLKYADRDAKRFVETVMGTQDPDNTENYLLHDEHEIESFRPTRSNILYFLSRGERRDKSNELDFLFFYFSGHGWSAEDGTDYLLTSDSFVTMPKDTAISVPMLVGHLRKWEAKYVVLFVDACRTVMTGGKSTTIPEEARINVGSLNIPGMVSFSSCAPGQTSYEADDIQSGVFTEGVCRALSNEGRCSTIEELDKYLNDKVPKISDKYGLPHQTPYSRVEPLSVREERIVSQRIREAWQTQILKKVVQSSPEATTQEEPLVKYREYVKLFWIGEQLSERDVQRLAKLADQLKVDTSSASAIEVDVMGETKEGILERQKRAAREKERRENLDRLYDHARQLHRDREWKAVIDIFARIYREDANYPDPEGLLASAHEAFETARKEEESLRQYRELVESAWADGVLDSRKVERLRDLADKLNLSPSHTGEIERTITGDTKEAILESQERAAKERYRKVVEDAWADNHVSDADTEQLGALSRELDLSMDTVVAIERDVMGDTKDAILERQVQAAREKARPDELYDRARWMSRHQQWRAVVEIFEQIHAKDPNYPDRERLLESAQEALRKRGFRVYRNS